MKTCTGCLRELSETDFSHDSTKSDGLRTRCKECCHKSAVFSKQLRTSLRREYLGVPHVVVMNGIQPALANIHEAEIEKTCTRCGKVKPVSAFCKAKQAQDGLHWWCKDCFREYRKTIAVKPSMKVCTSCKTSKPLSSFGRDKTKRDGLYTQCRDCKNARRTAHLSFVRNLRNQEEKEENIMPIQNHAAPVAVVPIPSSIDVFIAAATVLDVPTNERREVLRTLEMFMTMDAERQRAIFAVIKAYEQHVKG